MAKPHPLRVWLTTTATAIRPFCKDNEISFRALYEQFDGADPRLSTLVAIERATKGAVPVQSIANWWKGLKK